MTRNSRGSVFVFQVVQIIIGLLGALFSLTAVYSWALMLYAPFGLAIAVREHKCDRELSVL